MIASLSEAEKAEVWSSSPDARGMPGDFENIVRAPLNSVVSLDHLDENDLRVVADSQIDWMGRLCQGVDLHPFVTQAMHRGIGEGRVEATRVADAVLLHDKLNLLLWKAPSHLNPDEIQRMGRGCPDKNAKCLAINKLMIQRVVELQPTESRKFWVREGAKPIATSSNERDFFFGVVPKLNLQVAKPVVQECVAWIVANVPAQFKKGAGDAPEKCKAQCATEIESGAPPAKLPKCVDFDFGAYTLHKFELDASPHINAHRTVRHRKNFQQPCFRMADKPVVSWFSRWGRRRRGPHVPGGGSCPLQSPGGLSDLLSSLSCSEISPTFNPDVVESEPQEGIRRSVAVP